MYSSEQIYGILKVQETHTMFRKEVITMAAKKKAAKKAAPKKKAAKKKKR